MSIPITRLIRFPPVLGQGSGGLHDNYGSALAAQPGGSQGRPATNTSSQLIVRIGLPTLHAPSAPQPGWSHHTRRSTDHRRAWDTASIMPVTNALLLTLLIPLSAILLPLCCSTKAMGGDGSLHGRVID